MVVCSPSAEKIKRAVTSASATAAKAPAAETRGGSQFPEVQISYSFRPVRGRLARALLEGPLSFFHAPPPQHAGVAMLHILQDLSLR